MEFNALVNKVCQKMSVIKHRPETPTLPSLLFEGDSFNILSIKFSTKGADLLRLWKNFLSPTAGFYSALLLEFCSQGTLVCLFYHRSKFLCFYGIS